MTYQILEDGNSDCRVVEELTEGVEGLIAQQNWLPESYCKPRPDASYSQYPLYIDPNGAFCVTVVAFGPSIETSVHNHCVWGVIGVYQGEEWEHRYHRESYWNEANRFRLTEVDCAKAGPGQVSGFTAPNQDIHSIQTSLTGSVSIHVYGADIVKIPRLNFDLNTGQASPVYSCYTALPKV